MPEALRVLKRRIQSVTNTKQVTRAMEMVSAAKLRRTQEKLDAARPYSGKLRSLLARVTSAEGEFAHPLLEHRSEGRILLVLFSGDRGLAGAFNSAIIKKAEGFMKDYGKDRVEMYCVGRRGRDHFQRRDWTLVGAEAELRGRIDFEVARRVSRVAQQKFTAGEVDAVYLVYNSYVSTVRYEQRVEKFLPLDPEAMGAEKVEAPIEYDFEPSREAVFAELLPRYCESRMYTVLANALTAEHSARRIAMNNATQNCEDMIDSLTLKMNKARQASITNELLDIVGGAEAIQS